MTNPSAPDYLRGALDHGEVMELDGSTLDPDTHQLARTDVSPAGCENFPFSDSPDFLLCAAAGPAARSGARTGPARQASAAAEGRT